MGKKSAASKRKRQLLALWGDDHSKPTAEAVEAADAAAEAAAAEAAADPDESYVLKMPVDVTGPSDLFSPTPTLTDTLSPTSELFSPTTSSYRSGFTSPTATSPRKHDSRMLDTVFESENEATQPDTSSIAFTDDHVGATSRPESQSIPIDVTPSDDPDAPETTPSADDNGTDEPRYSLRVPTPAMGPATATAATFGHLSAERHSFRTSCGPSPTPSSPTLPAGPFGDDDDVAPDESAQSKVSSRAVSPVPSAEAEEQTTAPKDRSRAASPVPGEPAAPASPAKAASSPVRPTVTTTDLHATTKPVSPPAPAHMASPGGALGLKLEPSPPMPTYKALMPLNPMPSVDEKEEVELTVTPATSPTTTSQVSDDFRTPEAQQDTPLAPPNVGGSKSATTSPTTAAKRMGPPVPSRSTKPKSPRGHSWSPGAFTSPPLVGTLKTARPPAPLGEVLLGGSDLSSGWGTPPQSPASTVTAPSQLSQPETATTTSRSGVGSGVPPVPPIPSHLRPQKPDGRAPRPPTTMELAGSSALGSPNGGPFGEFGPYSPTRLSTNMAALLERSQAGMSPLVQQLTGNSAWRNSRASRTSAMWDELAWNLEHSPGQTMDELQEIPPEELTIQHSPMHRERQPDPTMSPGTATVTGSTFSPAPLPQREQLYQPRSARESTYSTRGPRDSAYSARGPRDSTYSATRPGRYRYSDNDAGQAREILETMRGAMAALTGTFDILHEQSSRVAALGPPVDSAAQIQSLRRRVRAQDKRQERRVGELKRAVREVIKDQIAEEMRAQIAEQIRTEMAVQVRSALAGHLGDTPAELRATAQESMRGLVEVRVGLQNSEARRANAMLRATNLDEPLASVLMSSGKAHELFPGTLRALFALDGPAAKTLVQAYDLPVADQREKNLNRLMSHIGLSFNVVPVGVSEHGELTPGGITLGITAA